jgi:hypothetical protein
MAKEKAAATVVADAFPLSLNEFCTRLSKTDRRVELIGAFQSSEKRAGRNKDTESAFAARYSDFINQPA